MKANKKSTRVHGWQREYIEILTSVFSLIFLLRLLRSPSFSHRQSRRCCVTGASLFAATSFVRPLLLVAGVIPRDFPSTEHRRQSWPSSTSHGLRAGARPGDGRSTSSSRSSPSHLRFTLLSRSTLTLPQILYFYPQSDALATGSDYVLVTRARLRWENAFSASTSYVASADYVGHGCHSRAQGMVLSLPPLSKLLFYTKDEKQQRMFHTTEGAVLFG